MRAGMRYPTLRPITRDPRYAFMFGSLTVQMMDKVPMVIRVLPDTFEERLSFYADKL